MGERVRIMSCKVRRVAFSLHSFPMTLVLGFILFLSACGNQEQEFHGIRYKPPIAAPEIKGVNWDGTSFHIADLNGKVALLFFGYTNCPDVCPLTMAKLASVYTKLGDQSTELQVVMVTTDPERDTPETLATYIKIFNPSFLAIQPAATDLAALLKAYGGLASKDPPQSGAAEDQYLVSHSNTVYVIDRVGNLRLVFPPEIDLNLIIEDLRLLLNE